MNENRKVSGRSDEPNGMPIALHGGSPVFPDGPPVWPRQDAAILDALTDAFQSGDWGRYEGPRLARLSEALSQLVGVEFALPCCSGTAAVELALRGLRIEAGREVILAGYDFAGNFRAVDAVGAKVVLVDIEPSRLAVDLPAIEQAFNPQTAAIIVSHLHGGLAPMKRLRELADRHRVAIVEDACQSVGATVDGRPVGSWGDVSAVSFGGSKLLTAGRGGMVLTSNAEIRQRIVIASQQGNHAYPLSELQAAVLLPQIEMLSQRNSTRLCRAEQLIGLLAEKQEEIRAVDVSNDDANRSAMFRLGFQLQPDCIATRDQVAAAMRAEGIAMDPGFRGFANRGPSRCRRVGTLSHSKLASQRMLLLHHAHLLESEERIHAVACAIRRVVNALNRTL